MTAIRMRLRTDAAWREDLASSCCGLHPCVRIRFYPSGPAITPIDLPTVPVITLPDGSQRSYERAVSVADVAASIGSGLARAALAGRVDGKLVDTSFVIERDAAVSIVTDRDPDGLEVIRHSTAHLLAQAVKQLFPAAQVTIGPTIEDGFYYDFAYQRPFTLEDLAAIEVRMKELAKADEKVTRRVMARDDAVRLFRDMGENYKAEIIQAIPAGEPISLYGQGDWVDLCRGPHVPSTGKLKAFKLMKLAGAYWRGDSRNEMLQRIYGTAWPDQKQLDAYLHRLEEAEKRDHRKIGRELDLFHMQEEAPGAVFWHPKGWQVFQTLIQYMRAKQTAAGFQEVNAPELMDRQPVGSLRSLGHVRREHVHHAHAGRSGVCDQADELPGPRADLQAGHRSYHQLPVRYANSARCTATSPPVRCTA
jgi:threonyl-tRNA synthetase